MVDRIGKGGPPPPTTPAKAPDGKGQPFEVSKPAATQPTEALTPSPWLTQLHAGVIDLNQYLDLKVEDATAHLTNVTPRHLQMIKQILRHRLATDPELIDLVERATGQTPTVREPFDA